MGTQTERPAPALAAGLLADIQRLVELQVQLARRELRELAVGNALAVGAMAAGGILIGIAVSVAVPVLLVALLPWHWEVAAVWIAAYALGGAVALLVGRARLRLAAPPKTVAELKENREWVLRRINSARS
jgi:MFS family permease